MEAQGHISEVPSSFIRSQTLPGHPGGLPDAPGGFRRLPRRSQRFPEAYQTLPEVPGSLPDALESSRRPLRRSRRHPDAPGNSRKKYSVTRSSLTVLDASKANSRVEPSGSSGPIFRLRHVVRNIVSPTPCPQGYGFAYTMSSGMWFRLHGGRLDNALALRW